MTPTEFIYGIACQIWLWHSASLDDMVAGQQDMQMNPATEFSAETSCGHGHCLKLCLGFGGGGFSTLFPICIVGGSEGKGRGGLKCALRTLPEI